MIVGPGAASSVRRIKREHPTQEPGGEDPHHVHHADPLVVEGEGPGPEAAGVGQVVVRAGATLRGAVGASRETHRRCHGGYPTSVIERFVGWRAGFVAPKGIKAKLLQRLDVLDERRDLVVAQLPFEDWSSGRGTPRRSWPRDRRSIRGCSCRRPCLGAVGRTRTGLSANPLETGAGLRACRRSNGRRRSRCR